MRKTVTIVFSDLSGSTALGERLDPETLRDIMSRYFDEMSAVLARHGGTVEKFIGDAIMAVFGIPQLHEDDAVRAVRAASEMRERLAVLNAELERDWAVTLAVRTGVNTGEVVAGDPSAGQRLVTGDTVNVAARLEQSAAAGEILLGEGTFRLVRDAVEAEPVSPLVLKGKSATVKAHRLLRVIHGAPGRARRLDSPMIGRGRERKALDENFARVASERSSRLVTILGAAGVGKSRLVAEFIGAVARSATVLQGRCLHYGEGITYWPVLEAVRTAAGIADVDPPAVQRRKIAAVLEGDPDAPRVTTRLCQLLGLEQGVAVKEETFWAIRRLFEAVARVRPVVLHFDDLQWAETTFLDLVEYIARQSHAPILLLGVARAELLEHRPSWGGEETPSTTIQLEALTETEATHLIANLLGSAQLAPQAQARITSAAEGNPLFVEEMLAMLIDDGLLRHSNGQWLPTQDLSTVAVPESIHTLLAARLDRLGPSERVAIEGGSVEGQVFHGDAVRELSDDEARSEIGPSLVTLTRKELIRPDDSSFAGDEAFRFRHILIRDAAYESMPKKTRAELHERFAAWLERVAADRAREFDEIVGYHLERSCRLRLELGWARHAVEDVARRAAAHLESSGRRAYDRGDMPAAVNLMSRAAGLGEEHDRARLSLLPDLARGYFELGKLEQANASLTEAIDGARATGDRGLEERAVLLKLFNDLFTDPIGDLSRIRERARRAIAVSSEARDERAMAVAWSLFGVVSHFMGHAAEGEDALWRSVACARSANDRPTECDSLGWLPIVVAYGPTPVSRGLARFAEMRAGVETTRFVGGLVGGWLLEQEGILRAMRGEFARARAKVAAARATYRDLGLTMSIASSSQAMAQIDLLADDPTSAESGLRIGEEALMALGETGSRSTVAALRAEALCRLGRHEESIAASGTSEALAWSEDVLSQVVLRAARGKSLARLGNPAQGERSCRDALTLAQESDLTSMHADTLVSLAEVLRLQSKDEEANTRLREALALYERKENIASARKVLSLLA